MTNDNTSSNPVIYDEDDWDIYLDSVNTFLAEYFPESPKINKQRMIPRLIEVSEGKDSRDVADAVTRWLRSADRRKQVRSVPAVLNKILPQLLRN
jgi:hypothetical protein